MKPKTPTNQSYEKIKELFNNGLDEEVDESVQTVSTTSQIKCIELTLNEWSYKDIQTYASFVKGWRSRAGLPPKLVKQFRPLLVFGVLLRRLAVLE